VDIAAGEREYPQSKSATRRSETVKKQDKKTSGAAKAGQKISAALTGPGLLLPDELDQAAGGNPSTTRGCANGQIDTSSRCLNPTITF
jgi:hypothetical protein